MSAAAPRRLLGAALLAALTVSIVSPIWAGGRSACAMCTKQCCCPKPPPGDRCALRRPCSPADAADSTTLPDLGKPALVPGRPVAGRALSGAGMLTPAAAPRTLRLALAPPDPPPRSAA